MSAGAGGGGGGGGAAGPVSVIVCGASGRLGGLIVEATRAAPDTTLVDQVTRTHSLEAALAGLADQAAHKGSGSAPRGVVVDVTTAGHTARHAQLARAHGWGLLVGTTGLSDDDHRALAAAAAEIPVLLAANLSVGAHLVAALAAQTARVLADADAEVMEIHHNKKKDAPSGTALMMAVAVRDARGIGRLVHARDGEAPRQPGDIGVVALRGGDVVGEHTVSFFLAGERVELAHKVSDRRIFARGALLAARHLATAAPGQHTMADVLGLSGPVRG